jgi:alanyl-tRNA synthetase
MVPTRRLYYDDSYLREFRAEVVAASPDRIYLNETAFYPASGGQPSDLGEIEGVRVLEVIDEGEQVAHILSGTLEAATVRCRVDWDRRFDHMQQHSGQHLLSAVFSELFGIETLSFHLGSAASTIDLDTDSVDLPRIEKAERRANEIIYQNRPVHVSYEDSGLAPALRKASARKGTLRIVSIHGVDRSACGGTHVRRTGEIGCILIRGTERIRGSLRVEFLCGARALRRARADFNTLSSVARLFSASPDETPALVAAQMKQLQESEKLRRKLSAEAARARGERLYEETVPDVRGTRLAVRQLASSSLDEDVRAEAQGFTALPKAIYAAIAGAPPSLLMAASPDSGVHAGNLLKSIVSQFGGKGGGPAQLAQGSISPGCNPEEIEALIRQKLHE